MHVIKRLWNKYIKKERENLKQVATFDGHTFYVLDALPNYAVNRFFYFISKSEEVNTLGIPLDYFLAIADQFEALQESPQLKSRTPVLVEMMRFACKKQEMKWYYMTIAVIEAFILVDDEKVEELSPEKNRLKRELLHNNPDARFFFTNFAADSLNRLNSSFNNLDLEDYLKNLTIEESLIESIMIPKEKST